MNQRYFILITLFLLLSGQFQGFAQESKTIDLMKDNIESLLPPLATIIDSAIARNPNVKFRDLQIVINNHQLKAFKNDWTRNLGVQVDGLYGTFDNISSNVVDGGANPARLTSRSTQLNYGAGAYLKIPLYDLINRRNQNQLARATVNQSESFAKEQRTELTQIVIKQYNELIIKHRLLKIKSKYIETARINMEMAEKQFLNGVINIAEYSSVSEILARGEADFEVSKMEFRTSFMLLEEIVGIKFNLTNKLN